MRALAESVTRTAPQAEVRAQRRAGIFGVKHAAPLQQWDHLVDEIARALSFDIPVLIAVPAFRFPEWLSFCKGMGVKLPCRTGGLQGWWNAMIVGEPRSERERQKCVCELSK